MEGFDNRNSRQEQRLPLTGSAAAKSAVPTMGGLSIKKAAGVFSCLAILSGVAYGISTVIPRNSPSSGGGGGTPVLASTFVDYVNTLGGTKSQNDLSTGNVLPEVVVPFGFNGWSPVTDTGTGGWWFYSEAKKFYGIKCTHQPSPWINDYGSFRVLAYMKQDDQNDDSQFSAWTADGSRFSPHYFSACLLSYGSRDGFLTMEVTPTWHGSLMRLTYPPLDSSSLATAWTQTRRVMFAMDGGGDSLVMSVVPSSGVVVVSGRSTQNNGGVPAGFGHFFYATVTTPDGGAVPSSGSKADGATKLYVYFDEADEASRTLVVRVATSLISLEQAKSNHESEVGVISFDDAMAAAEDEWNVHLGQVSIDDVGTGYTAEEEKDFKTIFYSSLYRASKYPRKLYEIDKDSGEVVHWSPYTNSVHPGRLSSDVGFWDAYRTTIAVQSLLWPSKVADVFEGWLNVFNEAGWWVQWTSPGFRNSMTGTMSDVSAAEVIMKLPHCGSADALALGYCVDAEALYAASRKNAYEVPVDTPNGRGCLEQYITLGYLPDDACDASVSTSLNYYHSDWALSQAATLLGKDDDAADLRARADGWRNLLEPSTAFLRPKTSAGDFLEAFDEFGWGGPYTEAGPWQYRLEVPFDPKGLKDALAELGVDACDVVQLANTLPGAAHPDGYGNEIHEMAEMQINCWGQWELNNQPVWALQHMQVAFDSSVSGKCASQAQYWLRKSNSLFHAGADMYAGDEDNGSFGAWYVFNTIGLYPLAPASGDLTFGSPAFEKVSIKVEGGATLDVEAVNQARDNVYVQKVEWNGVEVEGTTIAHKTIMKGGKLVFTMGPEPGYIAAQR